MTALLRRLARRVDAIPVEHLGARPEVVLLALVATAIAALLLPLPPGLTDVLLAANLALSVTLLSSVLLSSGPTSLSTFPSLLLLTTLFRLSLNVATARLILSRGAAGEIVERIGHVILGGDLVVGLVLFLIISVVQFIVIAKGAERVAEVGARFALDALPGRQMSIDAAVRSGSISEEEAHHRREALGRESQFHGAMDGAMKFVRGDAIAAFIITGVNLVAGAIIGVVRYDLPAAEALERYAVLGIGDALAAQIPALMITIAAGTLTTRVSSDDPTRTLARSLAADLGDDPRTLGIAAGFSFALGALPGLPLAPFLAVAVLLAALAGAAEARRARARAPSASPSTRPVAPRGGALDQTSPLVVPIALELASDLTSPDLLPETDLAMELAEALLPELRDALQLETGVRFPAIRIRTAVTTLDPGTCLILLREVPIEAIPVPTSGVVALESPARLRGLGLQARALRHPLADRDVGLVAEEHAEALRVAGIRVWSRAGLITLHLARVLRRHTRDFIGLQETADLLERAEKVCPALVREVVPKIVSTAQLCDILRRLADENVSIRDLKSILEALAQFGPYQTDGVMLTEHVRAALSHQIAHAQSGLSRRLQVLLLDPVLEDTLRSAITETAGGTYLALEPDLRRAILGALEQSARPLIERDVRPVILTSAEIRRYVRKLVEDDLPEVTVLSFQELPADLTVQPLGRVRAPELSAAGHAQNTSMFRT